MATQIGFNIGSGNGVLPEPMLTYLQLSPMTFFWRHYHKTIWRYQSINKIADSTFKNWIQISQGHFRVACMWANGWAGINNEKNEGVPSQPCQATKNHFAVGETYITRDIWTWGNLWIIRLHHIFFQPRNRKSPYRNALLKVLRLFTHAVLFRKRTKFTFKH